MSESPNFVDLPDWLNDDAKNAVMTAIKAGFEVGTTDAAMFELRRLPVGSYQDVIRLYADQTGEAFRYPPKSAVEAVGGKGPGPAWPQTSGDPFHVIMTALAWATTWPNHGTSGT